MGRVTTTSLMARTPCCKKRKESSDGACLRVSPQGERLASWLVIMSFETVISLARDNGYGMVIVFAGTKKNLREQSEDRLTKDLGIDEGDNWYHFSNPAKGVTRQIEDKIKAWEKQRTKKKAILVTVLKQVDHLDNLATVLTTLSLDGVRAMPAEDSLPDIQTRLLINTSATAPTKLTTKAFCPQNVCRYNCGASILVRLSAPRVQRTF